MTKGEVIHVPRPPFFYSKAEPGMQGLELAEGSVVAKLLGGLVGLRTPPVQPWFDSGKMIITILVGALKINLHDLLVGHCFLAGFRAHLDAANGKER